MRAKGLRNLTLSILAAAFLLAAVPVAYAQKVAAEYDYAKMFDYTRQMLTRAPVKKFLKDVFAEELKISPKVQKEYGFPEASKEISESQFVLLLQKNPNLWPMIDEYLKAVPEIKEDDPKQEEIRKAFREKFRAAIEARGVREKFKKFNDPLKPMTLVDPKGAGYRNVKFYANHIMIMEDGAKVPASSLKQVWIDFIKSAKKQFVLNVFDFDLVEVADAILERAGAGVNVRVGIFKNNIDERPEVKAIFDKLKGHKNVMVHAVESVGLNHQKLAARDWENAEEAAVLSSSGNLTQSCSGPEGDLIGIPAAERPNFSVPNANHMITMDSHILANAVNHELTKTLDPEYQLKGKDYPLSGAWQVIGGAGKDPKTDPWVVMVFSPHGGIGDINRDVLAQLILKACGGDILMLQFAFSSKTVEEALKKCAKSLVEKGKKFNFKAVGDTSFASRDWSVLLDMAGYTLDEKSGEYVDNPKSEWKKILGAKDFEELRNSIRAAPDFYGEHTYNDASTGKSIKVNAKTHHKLIKIGPYATPGTSYNFSAGALSNQEQMLVFKDPEIIKYVEALYRGFESMTTRTLEEAVLHKNEIKAFKSGIVGSPKKATQTQKKGGSGDCPDLLKP